LSEGELKFLRTEVLQSAPPSVDGFVEQLKGPLQVLTVFDRGTTGLGGPTRADTVTNESTDFVDFIRNVGQPPDKEFGGGTYGFGKSVFYRASLIGTILVHTRCRVGGRVEDRFIAACLGQPFVTRRRRFTGRHWWGVAADYDVGVDPIRGRDAASHAKSLGLPEFEDGALGTTIAIVAADLGEDPVVRMTDMAEATAWHGWPKMIGIDGPPDMTFSYRWENSEIPVPDPDGWPELREFAEALRELVRHRRGLPVSGNEIASIDCLRPRTHLGTLALRRYLTGPPNTTEAASPLGSIPHHTALLRYPRLVVSYRPGPESPVPGAAWVGVFLADPDVDRAFAASEPPSHDDWSWKDLPSRSHDRTFVRIALARIDQTVNSFAAPATPQRGGVGIPLGSIADALGGLLASTPGTGTSLLPRIGGDGHGRELGGTGRPSSERQGRRRRATIEIVDSGKLRIIDDQRVLVIPFHMRDAEGLEAIRVTAQARVAVREGGTTEREAPLAAQLPMVLKWICDDGTETRDQTLGLEPGDGRTWSVIVTVPDDTAVLVNLTARVP
jgi:hypothetical protein